MCIRDSRGLATPGPRQPWTCTAPGRKAAGSERRRQANARPRRNLCTVFVAWKRAQRAQHT
eukprot:1038726-Lingulodinium_polyedra.AAC.1